MIHVWGFGPDERVLSTVCAPGDLAVLAARYNGVYSTVFVRRLPDGQNVRVLRWPGAGRR